MACADWIDAERLFDKVVVLTDDVLYVASPSKEKALEVKAALDRGEAPSTVIKDEVTSILLNSVLEVSYNRHHDDIDIAYQSGKEKEDKSIYFSSREERDSFAAQLAELLSGFESKVVEYGRLRAALAPVGFGAFTALATWGLHAAAIEIAAGREADFHGRYAAIKRMVFWALDVIGPTGVLVAGGLVLALTVFGLVKRVQTPPIMHTLKRPKS